MGKCFGGINSQHTVTFQIRVVQLYNISPSQFSLARAVNSHCSVCPPPFCFLSAVRRSDETVNQRHRRHRRHRKHSKAYILLFSVLPTRQKWAPNSIRRTHIKWDRSLHLAWYFIAIKTEIIGVYCCFFRLAFRDTVVAQKYIHYIPTWKAKDIDYHLDGFTVSATMTGIVFI